ncbi:hypothetical protein [Planotetraspora silvatica]|uniref:hypothetical protein n=1 Tax=Planotetraspora silvatica TaxID=234614 RepID=UPI00194F4E8E|nr:hypothetical protein [Planotetraspora silvatica]
MRLRTTLLVALLSLATACGRGEATATTAEPEQNAAATPVAVLRAEGGFVTASMNVLRAPRVVVYSDGLVIADAAYQMTITETEVTQTVDAMKKFLTGQPPTASPKPGAPMVTDIPATVLSVAGDDGKMIEVRAEALEQVADFYPQELVAAKKLLDDLAVKATKENEKYTADRVRLAVESVPTAEGKTTPWPAGVPEPSGQVDPVWQKDLSGAEVSALVKAAPPIPDGGLPIFKTQSGVFVLSWRYLLPSE